MYGLLSLILNNLQGSLENFVLELGIWAEPLQFIMALKFPNET